MCRYDGKYPWYIALKSMVTFLGPLLAAVIPSVAIFPGGSESKCFRVLSSVIRIGSRFISPRGNVHKNGYGDSEEKLFRGIRTGAEKSGFKGAGCGLRVFGDGGREKNG